MLGSASRMFFNLLRRLRGVKKGANNGLTSRDALFPMRELAKSNNLDQRARLKSNAEKRKVRFFSLGLPKVSKLPVAPKPMKTNQIDENVISPVIPISFIRDDSTKSAIFDDSFMARIKSQSVSYTPDWFQYANRRSTTIHDGIGGGEIEEEFEEKLSKYADENGENEDAMFAKLITPERRAKKVMKIKIISKSPRSTSHSVKTPKMTIHEEIGGAKLPTPNFIMATPEAVRFHLEENWNNLSLARARNASNFSKARSISRSCDKENHLSLARARNVSNWKNISLARSRGISSSVQHMHRENSLSLSMALVSFQYALRRSTVTPMMDDDAFENKLQEFGEEHERLIEEQWEMFEKLTPNIKCYELGI